MNFLDTLKAFYRDFKKPILLALGVVGVTIVAVFFIALFVYNNNANAPKKITYQYKPVSACDLLTMSEAHKLLGKDVIGSPVAEPSVSGDVATSSCSYTDQNTNQASMKVAALAVLSAVNDKGVATVKSEFDSRKTAAGTKPVAHLGDEAYFDQLQGQLNILKGKEMLRISYGVGASPQANELDQAVGLARDILRK